MRDGRRFGASAGPGIVRRCGDAPRHSAAQTAVHCAFVSSIARLCATRALVNHSSDRGRGMRVTSYS